MPLLVLITLEESLCSVVHGSTSGERLAGDPMLTLISRHRPGITYTAPCHVPQDSQDSLNLLQ
jgi:hypothetical protein